MDQESSGIALVYVCVCDGDVGRLGCGVVLLYSIIYILYSIFNILHSIFFDVLSVVRYRVKKTPEVVMGE